MNRYIENFNTLEEFFNTNSLWRCKCYLREDMNAHKDTPIYITGTFGPQGKTTLKNLLIKEGFMYVLEMESVYLNSCDKIDKELGKRKKKTIKRSILENLYIKEFKKQNKELISKYMKEGLVYDFGDKLL